MKQNADKPLVVGLTGQTGAGKTTVSEAFRKNGYAVINADLVAREVTADPHIVARLGELFGQDVVAPDATLDRKALAAKVFSDPDELLKLNTILSDHYEKNQGADRRAGRPGEKAGPPRRADPL